MFSPALLTSRFRVLIVVPAVCLPTLCLVAALAPSAATAATRWSHTYGGSSSFEAPLDLHEMPDGTIIIAGYTDSFGTETADAWWIRLDGDGSVLDERVYGNALSSGATDAVVDADGGMAVVGRHAPNLDDHDAWIHHVDSNGVIDWQSEFDADPGRHSFYAVAHTTDGGYIASGSTARFSEPPIYAWVVKFDDSGGVGWQRRYNGGVAEHANFVTQTADSGYAVAGWTTSSGAGMTDVWLMKLDDSGVIQWQKTYGGIYQEEATGLIQTSDGGYAISAFTETFPASGRAAWVLRLDAAGDVVWHAVMGNVEWSDFRDVVQISDGDLVATGRISGQAANDLWVVKFRDSDGAVLWQRAVEGSAGGWGSRTVELSDGDLLIGGIWAAGFPEEDIWIQRADGQGRIEPCDLIYETAVAASAPNIFVLNAATVPSTPEPVERDVSFVTGASALTVDVKCEETTGAADPGSAAPARRVSVSPNPLRDSAWITFQLSAPARMRARVYDVRGRHVDTVAESSYPAGLHHVRWAPGPQVTPAGGVYNLVIELGSERLTRRVVVLR